MSSLRIFLSAGEASGDRYGAQLAAAIRERHPEVELAGLGGPRMQAAGVRLLAGLDRLAVVGFAEVVRHLPFFLALKRRVAAELERWRPDLVVPIDYPGFNLRLARAAYRRGIRVLYYVAPQVWAWHWSRARTIAAVTDAVAVVFPFEEELLRSAGVRAKFVGHPLVEGSASWPTRDEARRRLGLAPEAPVLGLFPGSRAGEVRRMLGPFVETARRLRADRPELEVRVARAPGLDPALYVPAADLPGVDDAVVLLRAATAALTKSGTTTVEAALAGTPMAVAYRVHPVTYAIARRVVRVPHIGMVNLLAGRPIVPEFVQGDVRARPMAEALRPLLVPGSEARRAMTAELDAIRAGLGDRTASRETADLVDEVLGRPSGSGGAQGSGVASRDVEAASGRRGGDTRSCR